MFQFKTFDVIVVDGLWYMPHHWLIKWRGLDKGVHCVTVIDEQGECWNPLFKGIEISHLDKYRGRTVTVLRYKGDLDYVTLENWGHETAKKSKGYDFIKQWLMGFVCGFSTKSIANDETKWTCAEFPYWGFQENGYPLTSREESLPMPRLFRYSDKFECVYEGKL